MANAKQSVAQYKSPSSRTKCAQRLTGLIIYDKVIQAAPWPPEFENPALLDPTSDALNDNRFILGKKKKKRSIDVLSKLFQHSKTKN